MVSCKQQEDQESILQLRMEGGWDIGHTVT
jgi:hypothetical protein